MRLRWDVGALEADTIGHPEATNLAVPSIYPKLAKKYGARQLTRTRRRRISKTNSVLTYCKWPINTRSPTCSNIRLSSKSRGNFWNGCSGTYGLKLDDLFVNYDVALNTYRWGFRSLIHEGTGIAWELYRQDIESLQPGIKREQFIQTMSRCGFREAIWQGDSRTQLFRAVHRFFRQSRTQYRSAKTSAVQAAAG